MRYLLLIHSDESHYGKLSEAEMGALMGAYEAFSATIAPVCKGSDRLQPTTVRVRNGDTITTDGPFAETKEQFGGYYEIDVDNLDEAIAWAAKVPTAEYGAVEVRPIWDYEG